MMRFKPTRTSLEESMERPLLSNNDIFVLTGIEIGEGETVRSESHDFSEDRVLSERSHQRTYSELSAFERLKNQLKTAKNHAMEEIRVGEKKPIFLPVRQRSRTSSSLHSVSTLRREKLRSDFAEKARHTLQESRSRRQSMQTQLEAELAKVHQEGRVEIDKMNEANRAAAIKSRHSSAALHATAKQKREAAVKTAHTQAAQIVQLHCSVKEKLNRLNEERTTVFVTPIPDVLQDCLSKFTAAISALGAQFDQVNALLEQTPPSGGVSFDYEHAATVANCEEKNANEALQRARTILDEQKKPVAVPAPTSEPPKADQPAAIPDVVPKSGRPVSASTFSQNQSSPGVSLQANIETEKSTQPVTTTAPVSQSPSSFSSSPASQIPAASTSNASMKRICVSNTGFFVHTTMHERFAYLSSQLGQFELLLSRIKDNPKDAGFKKLRHDIQKCVNIQVHGIDQRDEVIEHKLNFFTSLFEGQPVAGLGEGADNKINPSSHELGIPFAKYCLAKTLIEKAHLMGSTDTELKAEAVQPLAIVTLSLWQKFADFGLLFLALLYKSCPFLIPAYFEPMDEKAETTAVYEAYLMAQGYLRSEVGQEDGHTAFLKRLSRIANFYFTLFITEPFQSNKQAANSSGGQQVLFGKVQQQQPPSEPSSSKETKAHPHSLDHAWMFLARTVSMEPSRQATAQCLHECLSVCGRRLFAAYPRSFPKLFRFIAVEYFARIRRQSGDVLDPSAGQLKTLLDNA